MTSSDSVIGAAATQPTAKSRYDELKTLRHQVLQMAREVAEYTIPPMYPPEGHRPSQKLVKPWQSIGAKCVLNLASKLTLVLTTPGAPYFKLSLSPRKRAEIGVEEAEAFDNGLALAEQEIMREQERRAERVSIHEAIRHLIVAGNVLLYDGKTGPRVYPLHQYVCRRDGEGNLQEIVIVEYLSPSEVPEAIRSSITSVDKDRTKNVELYTWVKKNPEGTQWEATQHICDVEVTAARSTYPIDKLPYLALRWSRIDGEDYGRGLCEDYIGDLRAVDLLSKAITRLAVKAAKLVVLVKPTGVTRVQDLNNAEDGQYVPGDPEDVGALGWDKVPDFQMVRTTLEAIEQRLLYAFLVNSAIQRQAERVTAVEIRYMANELETALGGVYATLSQELQTPKVRLTINRMTSESRLPQLKEGVVDISVITGIDALGRNQDLARLDAFVDGIVERFGPAGMRAVNAGVYMRRRAAALGVDPTNLVYTDEELAAQTEAAQQAELVNRVAPNAVNQYGETYRHLKDKQADVNQQQAGAI